MRASADRLFLLTAALGALIVAATIAVTAVAGSALSADGSMAEAAAACRRLLLPAGPAGLAVLSLLGLAGAVVALTVRSLARQLNAQHRLHARLRRAIPYAAMPDVHVFAEPHPRAFCAGLLRPRVFVSSGAVQALRDAELDAVVAHERHHRERRDPLRLFLVRVLAEAFFFVPALRTLSARYEAVAELAADDAAARKSGAPALASALLSFGRRDSAAPAVGISRERADHLLGVERSWTFPAVSIGAALSAVAVLIAAAFAIAQSGTTLDLPLALARSCMLSMVLAPAVALLLTVDVASRLFARAHARRY